jgi:hypothetical protein
MNIWEIGSAILIFVVFFMVLMTILYFIHFQVKRKYRLQAKFQHPLKGRYLERYVPLDLKSKYETMVVEQRAELQKKTSRAWWWQLWKRRRSLPKLMIALTLSIISQDVFAEGLGGLESFMVENDSNSDQAQRLSLILGYSSEQRDLLWPYEKEAGSGWHWNLGVERHSGKIGNGTEFSGTKLHTGVGYKFGPKLMFETNFGVHDLYVNGRDAASMRGTPHLKLVGSPVDWIWMIVNVRNDYVYQEMYLPSGITEKLTASTVRLELIARPHENLRVLGRSVEKWMSNSNFRQEQDIAAMYGVSSTSPWIWLGAGANFMSYSFHQSSLWTPSRFSSFGPRLEAAVPVRQRLSLIFDGSWNLNQEEGFAQTQGYGYAAGLRYGTRGELEINALYRESKVSTSGQGFSNYGALLSVIGSF